MVRKTGDFNMPA